MLCSECDCEPLKDDFLCKLHRDEADGKSYCDTCGKRVSVSRMLGGECMSCASRATCEVCKTKYRDKDFNESNGKRFAGLCDGCSYIAKMSVPVTTVREPYLGCKQCGSNGAGEYWSHCCDAEVVIFNNSDSEEFAFYG